MDLQKEREAFEQHLTDTGLVEFAGYGFEVDECDEYLHEPTQVAWDSWLIGLGRAKAQTVPEWISVGDSLPPVDETVLVCWDYAADIEPEKEYLTLDEDYNEYWPNCQDEPPTHWLPLPKVIKAQEPAND